MSNCLAIVIPAYKEVYLRKTLESLARQTCRDFVVYIGDDASPYRLETVVNEFRDAIEIRYTRFDENVGGYDLVAQWKRCLGMVADEDWICLFSDDDMMEPRCVESFFSREIPDDVNVLHYDLKIIDENDAVVQVCPPFDGIMSSQDFYRKLFTRQIAARMPEFIFRRSFMSLVGFDLAWRSDTATVMRAALPGGICTVSTGDGDCVMWRSSSENISGNLQMMSRKNGSNISFFCWVNDFFRESGIENPFSRFYQLKTIVFALEYHDWKDFIRTGFRLIWRYNDGSRAGTAILVCVFLLYRLVYRQFELKRHK